MNGAEALIETFAGCCFDMCFANPGTSEMQLVVAIKGQHEMRAILGKLAQKLGRWPAAIPARLPPWLPRPTIYGLTTAHADALAHKGPRLIEIIL